MSVIRVTLPHVSGKEEAPKRPHDFLMRIVGFKPGFLMTMTATVVVLLKHLKDNDGKR